jgi:ABC-type multidrug transport system ATPase subunit
MSDRPAIIADALVKRYGATAAVAGVSFHVDEAELFGFIGPDGAGKTTLFRMIATLIVPDEGTVQVDGLDAVQDFRALRARLGYMPGRFSLYQDLTIEENLTFFASVFGTTIEQNYDLIRDIYVQIEPFKNRKAGALSGGMKQKLALSCALIHRPRVLLLDEPTTGVDAVSREEFWEVLLRIKASGITIVVSTPYMDEASLCDRVALIQDGRLLDVATPADITARHPHRVFAVKSDSRYPMIQILRKYPHSHSVYAFGEYVHYTDRRPDAEPDAIAAFLREQSFTGVHVHEIEPRVEDTFMELMAAREGVS